MAHCNLDRSCGRVSINNSTEKVTSQSIINQQPDGYSRLFTLYRHLITSQSVIDLVLTDSWIDWKLVDSWPIVDRDVHWVSTEVSIEYQLKSEYWLRVHVLIDTWSIHKTCLDKGSKPWDKSYRHKPYIGVLAVVAVMGSFTAIAGIPCSLQLSTDQQRSVS